jgi:predicted RNase H-like nuclease (RuvC/YqgF family)
MLEKTEESLTKLVIEKESSISSLKEELESTIASLEVVRSDFQRQESLNISLHKQIHAKSEECDSLKTIIEEKSTETESLAQELSDMTRSVRILELSQ